MAQIVFFAILEELIKLGIVSALKKTLLRIPSYFLFFAVECLMKWNEVYANTQALGSSAIGAFLASMSVVVGSSLFHLYTSILYTKVRFVWPALVFCTALHAGWNYGIDFLPRFEFSFYVAGPWIWAIVTGSLIFGYWRLERRVRDA